MIYVLNGNGLATACATKKDANAFMASVDDEQKSDHAICDNSEDLASFSLKTLTTVFNACVDEANQIKKLGDKTGKSLLRVWDALEMKYNPKAIAKAEKAAAKEEKAAAKEAGATKAKKDPDGPYVPREGSKFALLYSALQKAKKGLTVGDLADASGFDEQNTRTAIGILRSKKQIPIAYDRDSKVYTLAA